jgi:hypothetical protein
MDDDRSYKNDDVRAIIDRALASQPQEGVSHEDLLAIGGEVGLSRTALERAALEVREERLNEAARELVVARRRRGFLAHAVVFLAVNAFLFAINVLTTPGQWWVLFPVFAWGFGLLMHALFGISGRVSTRALNRAKRVLEQRRVAALPPRLSMQSGRVRARESDPDLAERDAESQTKRTL